MKLLTYPAILFFLMAATACGTPDLPVRKTIAVPQLIVFGEDVSGTFKQHERLHPDELRRLCLQLLEAGMEAAIYIGPIGNPDVKPFLKCELKPPQTVNPEDPLSKRKQQAIRRQRDTGQNQKAVEQFIQDYVAKIYKRKPEMNTDIGGFLDRAEQILDEPRYARFQKTLFLHSDGFHDVGGHKNLPPLEKSRFEGVAFRASGIKDKGLVKNLDVVLYGSPRSFVDNFLYALKPNNNETEQ